ncbi:hypothetical protein PR202_ga08894 [Eleusine coracana subsp. coracana]|uniref:Probable magnesium transporter n=1 Tax=Eleusine coracana subsp. coracana TaxID=191504 RepID=A0AAV5C3B7_ELECO|nr:hypothetical protein PR202_ga08894 [Eleusine coracana subsp. coracana]
MSPDVAEAEGSDLFAANLKGALLAVASSAFIGVSFIVKKKGLRRAGAVGSRAGVGGYGYLREPLWWVGMVTTFLCYAAIAVAVSLFLMLYCSPRYGQSNIIIYVGICSVIGSLTVMSIKAVGIAIKLTIEGINQAGYFQTWLFAVISVTCIVIQLVYLNKALDTFNTAVVSPIYYAMFTTLTILASAIMFKDWSGQRASNIASEICGFLTVLAGTIVLHSTREPDQTVSADLYTPLPPKIYWHIQGNSDIGKQKEDDSLTCEFITVMRQDYFV